ncbi:MAG: YidC/Oxa1 family membrane protein insertase [Actinobacteria bacterium]|nr:YidC/Oxa1 family membrane protein insertase [Actinomycetota bacterium]
MQEVWDAIREGLGWLLAFFYSIIPNTGVSIIMLTVVVRLALFPLTAKQAKSMIAMQKAQPEIKKIQAKYKNSKDPQARQKLNEELMAFYKEHKINPLGGCLPILAQMPVFLALYQTLNQIQKFIPTDSQMFADVCGSATTAAQCKNPQLIFFGMDLTQSASAAKGGFGSALPYFVLVGLVVVTAYLQQRQTMRAQTQANPQMQVIGKVLPVVFGFIALSMPAGVTLYFFTSNLWQLGQQEVVYRKYHSPQGAGGGGRGDAGGKGGGAAIEAKSTEVTKDKSGGKTNAAKGADNAAAKGGGGTASGGGSGGSGGTNRRRNNRKRKR